MRSEDGGPTRLVRLPLADASAGEQELVLTARYQASGA